MLSLYFNRWKKYQLYNSLAWSRIYKWLTKLSVILLFFYLNYHPLKTKWTWLKRSQRPGKTKYSHLIFQMTSILTTISATKRARPTNQVFDGSNNNLFIHSIKKCESKSFQFDFALFLRTAILSIPLDYSWNELSLAMHNIRIYTKISDHYPKRWGVLECTNMAKSLQLLLVITAIFAGLFLERGVSQRQICSYYGMNILSFCYDCYSAQVSLRTSSSKTCCHKI